MPALLKTGGELGCVLLLFAAICLVSEKFQPPVTHNHGQGNDGVFYCQVAEQFAEHEHPHAEAPFVYRIGTPWIVAKLFPDDILRGFKIVNWFGDLSLTILLFVWFRLMLADWRVRLSLVAAFLMMWHGPVRYTFFYPAYTDPWLFVALLAGFISIESVRRRPRLGNILLLSAIVFVGVLFRESAMLIALAVMVCRNPITEWPRWKNGFQIRQTLQSIPAAFYLPLVCGALGIVTVHWIASSTNQYSFSRTALAWIVHKPPWTYLHAWFIAYGPILVLPIYFWRTCATLLAKNQALLIVLLGIAFLGYAGGADTERILFWGSPVVLLLAGQVIERCSLLERTTWIEKVAFLLLQAVASRWFLNTPSTNSDAKSKWPVLTYWGNYFPNADLFSYHGNQAIEWISLAQYVALFAVLLWWINHRRNAIECCEQNSEPAESRS